MRSIGKVKIKKLREMVQEALKNDPEIPVGAIMLHYVPYEWFDLWEGAYTEIENLIYDELTK